MNDIREWTTLMDTSADYELYRGGERLAVLTRSGVEFPWYEGGYEPTASFLTVRHLFDRELALLNDDQMDEWELAWEEIRLPGLLLHPRDGRPDITEFVIHFDEEGARWRY
jgi:hypothetical protein